MILVSKFIFSSVAVATLAGSLIFSEVVEIGRSTAASLIGGSMAEVQQTGLQQGEGAANGSVQLPYALPHCPGQCEIWVLLSQIR